MVQRLCEATRRPAVPMGEAWFMSEVRKTFPALMGDLDTLPLDDLIDPLREIASGPGSFGDPCGEWGPWFHYLMPRLLPRAMEGTHESVLEYLVTGLFALHPQDLSEAPFRQQDVLLTLGRCLMEAQPWLSHGYPTRECWICDARSDRMQWHSPHGVFNASAFLQLKCLPSDDVPAWVVSMLDIPSPLWRAEVLPWLVGIHPLLTGELTQPEGLDAAASHYDASWAWSHCLKGQVALEPERPPPAVSRETCEAVIETVRRCMSHERLCAWLDSFKPYRLLDQGMFDVPERFARYYLD
jgi:hypothetical protein